MFEAWLIIGPTGSGKTPLGEALELAGWNGRRCLHFDLGEELRRIAAGRDVPPGLSSGEREVIGRVLRKGELFEDRQAPLVRKIIDDFLRRRGAREADLLLLNGWPRHPGQARDLEAIARVRRIVFLNAPAAVLRERIRTDAGGDRAGRRDDSAGEVEAKLALFEERTRPLLAHYAAAGVPIVPLDASPTDSAEDLLRALRRAGEREGPGPRNGPE